MTHRTLMGRRARARRAGADLTQSLLFAAFSLFVVMGVLYGFSVLDLRKSKADTTAALASMTGEVRGLFAAFGSYGGLTTAHMIEAGGVPPGNVRQTPDGPGIMVPHGGVVTLHEIDDPHAFRARVEWPVGGRVARGLCLHLASTPLGEMGSGPMGTDYEIEAADCNAQAMFVSALYRR